MPLKIIDAHLHLDEKVPGSAEAAVASCLKQLKRAGVHRAVLLHLETQRWSLTEVADAVRPHGRVLSTLANIKPGPNAAAEIKTAQRLGFRGLKLHPRLHDFSVDAPATIALVRAAGELGWPVVIDAFPDGTWIERGFDPAAFARLARSAPEARIVAAHMGGHRVLDFMMLAKRVPNLHLDCSFSLLYYRGSSVPGDIVYAMRSMKFARIFYGSDAPDRPAAESLKESLKVMRAHGMKPKELERILHLNARNFFQWES